LQRTKNHSTDEQQSIVFKNDEIYNTRNVVVVIALALNEDDHDSIPVAEHFEDKIFFYGCFC
jgi:hypothetical protein